MIEEKNRASSQSVKVLGIPWDALSDKVSITATIELADKETRSTISGAIASNFDPLGLMVPLLLPAKLYQRDNLWNSKYDWKTTISPEDQAKWAQVAENINGFTREIPRNVVNKTGTNKLITFCDASKEAAAFCIYAHDGSKTHIVFGKSKIRPLKEPWTIPKLETHALMMGTTKTLDIYKALKVDNIAVDEVIILTDSSIALDQLKSIPSRQTQECWSQDAWRASDSQHQSWRTTASKSSSVTYVRNRIQPIWEPEVVTKQPSTIACGGKVLNLFKDSVATVEGTFILIHSLFFGPAQILVPQWWWNTVFTSKPTV